MQRLLGAPPMWGACNLELRILPALSASVMQQKLQVPED